MIKDGDMVVEGQELVTHDDGTKITAAHSGKAVVEKGSIKITHDAEKIHESIIPPGFATWVKTGDMVKAGDQLTEGDLDLQQLFAFQGKNAVQHYLSKDIQSIYASQGQKLNNKHIEIIIRQMFSRVRVLDPGDTDLLPGEIIEKASFHDANDKVKKGEKPAESESLFLGITKISLSTDVCC